MFGMVVTAMATAMAVTAMATAMAVTMTTTTMMIMMVMMLIMTFVDWITGVTHCYVTTPVLSFVSAHLSNTPLPASTCCTFLVPAKWSAALGHLMARDLSMSRRADHSYDDIPDS